MFRNILISLRPKNWIKNLLIFLPLIFGGKLFNPTAFTETIIAIILFSLTSSAVYVFNDVIDINYDKHHPEKKKRPIASGKLTESNALAIIIILVTVSIYCSHLLDKELALIIGAYIVLNIFYSIIFKNIVIIDVLCIAVFFLLRVMAGTTVANVVYSHWMIFMVCLLAIFLGFNKRRQELSHFKEDHKKVRPVLRKYNTYLLDQMISITTASVVIVYMIYTVDSRTIATFGTNHLMYTIPFLYYGIFRYLYLVHKKNIDGDPTSALVSDLTTQINIVFWVFTSIAVIYLRF